MDDETVEIPYGTVVYIKMNGSCFFLKTKDGRWNRINTYTGFSEHSSWDDTYALSEIKAGRAFGVTNPFKFPVLEIDEWTLRQLKS